MMKDRCANSGLFYSPFAPGTSEYRWPIKTINFLISSKRGILPVFKEIRK
jgi:hypothetical protein